MDFMGKVEKAIGRVAKKATEVKEISKIKYSVYDLNQDVKKLYTEIGKKVYQEMRESSALTEDIRLKCEIVEAKLARVAALQEKEAMLRDEADLVYCPICGQECDVKVNFCPVCGSSLVQEVKAEVSAEEIPQDEQ